MQVIHKCRNQKVSSRHPSGAKFCANCKHYTLVDIDGFCFCCAIKIPNRKQLTELKKFDKILKSCGSSIESWAACPCIPDLEFGWPIRIGIITYYVPVRFLAEYAELPQLEGENVPEKFLEAVKRECSVLPRYIHSIR